MAKLAAFTALLLALIAVSTAYTTVVTTTVINDDENPQPPCQTEADWMQMTHCKKWMGINAPYETTPFLRSAVDHEKECCKEMWRVHEYCRCDMIRKMMGMRQRGWGMGKMQSMFSKCGMEIPVGCRPR